MEDIKKIIANNIQHLRKETGLTQLDLAEKLNMPVIIHDREAHGDVMDMLSVHKNSFGIFHSYSGSGEMAKQVIKMGENTCWT